jgi:ATP-binding cassette, subfamily C, bacterial exporter for protease/lipase
MSGFIDRFLNTNPQGTTRGNPVSDLLRQCKRSFVFVALVTLLVEVLAITPIIFMWNVFDRVITSRSMVTLVSLLLVVMLVYGFWSALEWVRTRMMIRISLRIDWDISARIFDAAFRRHAERKEADVHQALNDIITLRAFLTGAPLLALMSAPYAIVFIVIGWAFHPYLAIFIAVATLVQLLAAYSTSRITSPSLREANTASSAAQRLAAASVRHSDTALALGMLPDIRSRWFRLHQRFLGLQVNASESAGLLGGITTFLAHAMPSLQIALSGYLVIMGELTGGMMIAAMFLLRQAVRPLAMVMGSWSSIQSARLSLERLNKLAAQDEAITERMPLPVPVGHLQVHDLLYHPPQARNPVLHGIHFEAAPGQVLAIVGPSGSGKTSLIRTLVGLVTPTEGSVRLDGADIRPWILDDLGQHIGYVPQEIDVFEGTVAENIARLGPVVSELVVDAAQAIGLHRAILALPNGYETRLGVTGHALTGGQKQRLAIARALYQNPVYLVMDEPNANLDDEGERTLCELIEDLKDNGTLVIFSSHRPRIVATADLALVLHDGGQMAFGKLKDVVAAGRKRMPATAPQRVANAPAPPATPTQPQAPA